jgi:hypothetical protein
MREIRVPDPSVCIGRGFGVLSFLWQEEGHQEEKPNPPTLSAAADEGLGARKFNPDLKGYATRPW